MHRHGLSMGCTDAIRYGENSPRLRDVGPPTVARCRSFEAEKHCGRPRPGGLERACRDWPSSIDSPWLSGEARGRGVGPMYCSNGHEIAVGKQDPKFCPTCGDLLTTRCPNGHEIPAGASGCEQCGATGVGIPGKPLSAVADPVLPGL